MTANYPPGFSYPDFASSFTAELWNPQEWAELFAQVRRFYMIALFIAPTLSRAVWGEVCRADVQAPRGIPWLIDCSHCPMPFHRSQGFTNWPSSVSWNWNSVVCISVSLVRRIGLSCSPYTQTTGPHRDLVGELTAAVRAQNLTMGLYHSMYGR